MLDSLNFVRGAVAKNDFIPSLTHFHIANGTINGYNGQLALCSPVDLDLTASPKAVPFIKAIQACKDTISIHLTRNNSLSVSSGKFKAFVECTLEPFPHAQPEGVSIPSSGNILETSKELLDFISDDMSRPFASSLLLSGQSAYATNNIILVEKWVSMPFPIRVAIPKGAVEEIVRINEEPTSLRMAQNSVTFSYKSGRWLRTQLLNVEWPNVEHILNKESNSEPIPAKFFDALKTLEKFADEEGKLFLNSNLLRTHSDEEKGAQMIIDDMMDAEGLYTFKPMRSIQPIATHADFSKHPYIYFFHDKKNIRGCLVGRRS